MIHHTRHEERRTCQGNLKEKEKYKTETTRNCHGNPKKKNEKDENALRERIKLKELNIILTQKEKEPFIASHPKLIISIDETKRFQKPYWWIDIHQELLKEIMEKHQEIMKYGRNSTMKIKDVITPLI